MVLNYRVLCCQEKCLNHWLCWRACFYFPSESYQITCLYLSWKTDITFESVHEAGSLRKCLIIRDSSETYWKAIGVLLETCRRPIRDLLETYRIPFGDLSETYWIHTGDLLKICCDLFETWRPIQELLRDILETHGRPTCLLGDLLSTHFLWSMSTFDWFPMSYRFPMGFRLVYDRLQLDLYHVSKWPLSDLRKIFNNNNIFATFATFSTTNRY